MLPRAQEKKPKLTLDEVIQKLVADDIHFTELNLQDIIANPLNNVNDNSVKYCITDNELETLAKALIHNKTLIRIIITGSDPAYLLQWTKTGAHTFGESIKDHPALKGIILHLRPAYLPEEAITGFFSCLTGSAALTHFTLTSHFNNSVRQLNLLGSFLQNKHCLQELYLDGKTSMPEEKKDESLAPFANSLASFTQLQTLSLKRLSLKDSGIKELTETLESIVSLKKIRFASCEIINEINGVCSLALHNPMLRTLDLSGNALTIDATTELINTLPFLTYLFDLNLTDINLTYKTFAFFVSIFTEYQLKISHLTLDRNNFGTADPSFHLTSILISKNKNLKRLDLNFTSISDHHIQHLAKTLEDPEKCALEELHISGLPALKISSYHLLTGCLYKNENINLINTSKICMELRVAGEVNKRRKALNKWEVFNLAVLIFLSGKHPVSPLFYFSSVSLDIIKQIFSYIRPKSSRTPSDSYLLSIDLTDSNLQNRTSSILKGTYHPSELKKIGDESNSEYNRELIKSKWWRTESIESKHSPPSRCLFLPRHPKEPSLMLLPDILTTLSPFASTARSVTHPHYSTLDETILIDVSMISPGQQRFIRDVFRRFFTIFFKDTSTPSPTAVIQTQTHELQIQGVSIVNLQRALRSSHNDLMTQENKSCCRMM